jgi:ribonuclease VapC
MIVDTSVVIAILHEEDERARFTQRLVDEPFATISAASYVEAGVALDRRSKSGRPAQLDELLNRLGVDIAPVTEAQARLARAAHAKFGRGSGHPAQLNFGDCFAYALAIDRKQPLLFKGGDFAKTDVVAAL